MSIERRVLTHEDRSTEGRDAKASRIITDDSARLLRGRANLGRRYGLIHAMDDAGVLTRGELLTRLGEVMQDEERSEASLRSIIEHQHRMILNPGERMDYGDAMLRH